MIKIKQVFQNCVDDTIQTTTKEKAMTLVMLIIITLYIFSHIPDKLMVLLQT